MRSAYTFSFRGEDLRERIKIAVDAMGGDKAPAVEVEGAVLAAREYDVDVLLVGDQQAVRRRRPGDRGDPRQ
jgi:fatty acid/phospholipid biosynthesis enzyme